MTKQKAPYYTYIIQCADGTFYTGKTNDLELRIKKHNGDLPGGAKYTRSRRPVMLVYSEICEDNAAACKREREIKKLSRQEKYKLIT